MCGLVGIIARKPAGFYSKDLDLFEQMLVINTIRGRDSVGVMTALRDKDVLVVKHATRHASLLFETADYKKWRGRAIGNGRFVMGHNRAATRGAPSTDNAHPFVEENIILMHNGTIFNQEGLSTKKVEVDSHAICHALAESGDIEEVVQKINGAFALIWYDTKNEKLHAIRNEDRPLNLIITEDQYYLASEAWIAGMPVKRADRKIQDIVDIEPGTLLTWDLTGKMEERKIDLDKPKPIPSGRNPYWESQHKYYGGEENYPEDDLGEPVTKGPIAFPKGENLRTPREQKNLGQVMQQMKERESSNASPTTLVRVSTDVPALTGPTPTDKEIERQQVLQQKIIIENSDFPPGQELLVKIWSIGQIPNGRYRWQGKIMHPDKPMLDAQGIMPSNILPNEFTHWIETTCVATTGWATYTSNGGAAIFFRDVRRAVFTDVHGKDIPLKLWAHAAVNGCTECFSKIEPWERIFTHVKLKHPQDGKGTPVGKLECLCPDCLMKALPNGGIHDTFYHKYFTEKARIKNKIATTATNRDSSVQDRESVSPESGGSDGKTAAVQGSQTLQ